MIFFDIASLLQFQINLADTNNHHRNRQLYDTNFFSTDKTL